MSLVFITECIHSNSLCEYESLTVWPLLCVVCHIFIFPPRQMYWNVSELPHTIYASDYAHWPRLMVIFCGLLILSIIQSFSLALGRSCDRPICGTKSMHQLSEICNIVQDVSRFQLYRLIKQRVIDFEWLKKVWTDDTATTIRTQQCRVYIPWLVLQPIFNV